MEGGLATRPHDQAKSWETFDSVANINNEFVGGV